MNEAMKVKCPKCGAKPGEQCQKGAGGVTNWLGMGYEHIARKRAADAHSPPPSEGTGNG